jgi:predicted Ser/Thr protein kinase
MASGTLLKEDFLGAILLAQAGDRPVIVRQFPPGFRGWLAARLAAREARALKRLAGLPGIPRLLYLDRQRLVRSYIEAQAMYLGKPRQRDYFRRAARLLRRMHRRGVAHNDLAKEANWLCLENGDCGIVDFQLAVCTQRRGRWFRLLAREDLRHMLKHKRHYLPQSLTARERTILARPGLLARAFRRIAKPPYLFLTRRLLGWPERSGPIERESRAATRLRRAGNSD